jgi:hypothetical protein
MKRVNMEAANSDENHVCMCVDMQLAEVQIWV